MTPETITPETITPELLKSCASFLGGSMFLCTAVLLLYLSDEATFVGAAFGVFGLILIFAA